MRPIYFICLIFLLFGFAQEGFSQEQAPQRRTRQRASEAATNNTPALTERAKIKNEVESKAPAHIVWLREIYRYVDLEKESNAPLYYPVQPIGNRMNLFTLIFKLMMDGKLTAYKYLDGREVFTEEQIVDFEVEILKKYQIIYTKEGNSFVIDDNDIPSSEALLYMIKEGWYFDEATGTFKTQIIAICPHLVRADYYYGGEPTRDPLFWIPYENLRPYLSRELIMTSNYNNALTYTMDDYFSKKMYSGEIVKTTNLMNKSLAQQVGADPEALKHAQDSIESQLEAFNKNLWVHNDTISLAVQEEKTTKENKKDKETKKTSGRGAKKEKEAEKPKASSAEKSSSSSSPSRSVRRR
jgi:gliding motility associated protien GldN